MNENLQIISMFSQLGMGGVMLYVAFVIWNRAQAWMVEQQARDDKRWTQVREQDKALLGQTLQVLERQGQTNLETASLLQQAAADLRVATDRLSCGNARGN